MRGTYDRQTEKGSTTRFVLTPGAAGVATPEIASAGIASGLRPPAVPATAVSGAAPLRAPGAAQAQHVRPNEAFPGPPPKWRPASQFHQPALAALPTCDEYR
jgi:hypothetical protein